MAGFMTPSHALLIVGALAVFVVLGRLSRGDARDAAARGGRRARAGWRHVLTRPSRAQANLVWLVASAVVALALTRAVAIPLFLLVFLVVWLAGYGVLARLYR